MRYLYMIMAIMVVVFMSASAAGEITSPGPVMLDIRALWGSDHHYPPPPPPRSKRCPPDHKDDHGDKKDDHGDHGDHRDRNCGKGDDSKNP